MSEVGKEFSDNFIKQIEAILREHGAVLHITKPTYAYLKLGCYSFYFHKSGDKPVITKEIETLSGEKLTQHILPYDGWEMSCE